jgi:hypothetical protein
MEAAIVATPTAASRIAIQQVPPRRQARSDGRPQHRPDLGQGGSRVADRRQDPCLGPLAQPFLQRPRREQLDRHGAAVERRHAGAIQ